MYDVFRVENAVVARLGAKTVRRVSGGRKKFGVFGWNGRGGANSFLA